MIILRKDIPEYEREDKKIADILEKADRFETFVLMIDAIHKAISRIKQELILDSEIKSVHTFWLYELLKHKDGLTASELATRSKIDRSLVSREVQALFKSGYIEIGQSVRKRVYNSRITLTEEGRRVAKIIADTAYKIQGIVSSGISDEELKSFYSTLEKIYAGLDQLGTGSAIEPRKPSAKERKTI